MLFLHMYQLIAFILTHYYITFIYCSRKVICKEKRYCVFHRRDLIMVVLVRDLYPLSLKVSLKRNERGYGIKEILGIDINKKNWIFVRFLIMGSINSQRIYLFTMLILLVFMLFNRKRFFLFGGVHNRFRGRGRVTTLTIFPLGNSAMFSLNRWKFLLL